MGIYKLGNLVEIKSGDSYKNAEWAKKNIGIYPFYSSKTINDAPHSYINSFEYDGNFVTIAGSGEFCGKVFYRTGKFSIMQRVWLLKNKEKIILNKYLFFLLKTKENEINKMSRGSSTQPNINKSTLMNFKIFIPSLETQRSIIEIIEPLKKQIDLVNLKINMFKNYFKYKLQYLLNDKNFTEIYQLNDLVEIKSGDPYKNAEWAKKNIGIYPFYSSKTINDAPHSYINSFEYDGNFVTIAGSGEFCGKVFYRTGKFSIMQRVWLLKNKEKIILNKYLFFLLKTKENEINKMSRGSSTQPNINKSTLMNFEIFIPSLEIQQSLIHISELYL